MDIKVTFGAIQKSDADTIIVGLFKDAELEDATLAVDQALDGAIRDMIDGGD